MATESPYPSGGDTSVQYRLSSLEKWRDAIERDALPKTLAIMDERQRNDHELIVAMKAELDFLKKRDSERSGFINGNKAVITVAGLFLLNLAGVILQVTG